MQGLQKWAIRRPSLQNMNGLFWESNPGLSTLRKNHTTRPNSREAFLRATHAQMAPQRGTSQALGRHTGHVPALLASCPTGSLRFNLDVASLSTSSSIIFSSTKSAKFPSLLSNELYHTHIVPNNNAMLLSGAYCFEYFIVVIPPSTHDRKANRKERDDRM